MSDLSAVMFLHCLISFMIFTIQFNIIQSDCSHIDVCTCSTDVAVCDANDWNKIELNSSLPSVGNYYFHNFKQIPEHAFRNLTFLSNRTITIHLINIKTISSDAFSPRMIIPDTSTLSINIERSTNSSSITLQSNAFNHIKIKWLRFFNINNFNGRSIFDTNCFGENLYLNELIFQKTGITGFSTSQQGSINVRYLSIRESPQFTQLTSKSLPSFFSTTESFEISNTKIQLINPLTFQSKSLKLKELIIRDNMYLKTFSSNIVDGTLKTLEKFDFSNNPIVEFPVDYDWSVYINVKHLILQQQHIDLFLRTNILKTLETLTTIDFSEGFIEENNEDLMHNYIPLMPHLASFNISYTNMTQKMIIDLLERLTKSSNQSLTISLLGYTFNDGDYCSYYAIIKKTLNFLEFEIDEKHECNCIIDLFYNEKNEDSLTSISLQKPMCLLNTTRIRCDIASQILNCPTEKPNPDESGTNGNNNINYVRVGALVGLAVVLIVIIGLSSIVVVARRRRQQRRETERRMTAVDMEAPIENPLTVIMAQRSYVSY